MNSSRRVTRTAVWMSIGALILTLAACGGGNSPAEANSFSTSSDAIEQAQILKASDYFVANTSVGDHRTYFNTDIDSQATNWSSRVETIATQQSTVDASSLVLNNTKLDGSSGFQQYVLADPSGLWLSSTPIDAATHAGAKKLLPAEFKVGDTFVQQDSTTDHNETDADGGAYTIAEHTHTDLTIAGKEDIATLAGQFKDCLKTQEITTVTTTNVRNGISSPRATNTINVTTWYAPGVGKVKEITKDTLDAYSATWDLYAYQIAGIGNEQIRPTATIGTVARLGMVGDARIFAIQFSEPMLLTTVNSDSVQVIDPNGQQVPITISTPTLTSSLTVDADASYTPVSGTYQIKLSDKIKDLAGNGLVPLEQSLDVTITQPCCNWSGTTVYLWAH